MYASVVTVTVEPNGPPLNYYISPVEGDKPQEGKMGDFGHVRFASPDQAGCTEADLIGILMSRLSCIAQDGKHRHYERALVRLEEALECLGETLEVEGMDKYPIKMLTERVE